ncbi:hypothetical protein [Phenylobacterium sp.]|jgi:hypothetical protein|uniref:hypothetical protein n=1 Tax=Phenylobacterium sp. TaxID=1871053 RepID=UPI002F94D8DE
MRAAPLAAVLAPVLALASAGPAAAQVNTDAMRFQELQMQQEMMRQRMLSQELELNALDSRLRTEQAIRDVQTQRTLPPLPLPPPAASPRAAVPIDTSKLASMPDDRLAASNDAVREASRSRP